ncbi:MAG TPA: RpiB/LacA/LacB family sugar-phosphate isomerase [Candidatus Limnocylindria bacterium]|nr:RpiB/LacA/LacB family sugar-phosphate isomerase [Candidatus Limnocylindria bacterium]
MRVALATDHAGLPLKAHIADWLAAAGHEIVDFGVDNPAPVDYPDVIAPAAQAVARGDCQLGIVLGGSGSGEQIVANKVRGIRCVEASEPVTARLGREHNDANMLALGARIVGSEVALACVAAFIGGEFQGGRHQARIDKIARLEAQERGEVSL